MNGSRIYGRSAGDGPGTSLMVPDRSMGEAGSGRLAAAAAGSEGG
ncbi:MAG: hypothetical protein PHN90_02285 [Methanothrix sp.]|nr:hypothetical protein [Methanothrix sp.]HOI69628.1 hypothetical protein [Methanothrix sp.]HPY71815.1 hypothetical protein [Methanothrix sp.]HQA61541.1 hypothetical protein [Methanothrix sp.]